MPKIEAEISPAAKRLYNKLKKAHGEDFVLENLLNDYKQFETAAAEKEILEREIEALKNSPVEGKSMGNGSDILAVMNATIEVYARENERLLKIANFSEYDEKINRLKTKNEEQLITISGLDDSLKNEKKKAVDLEYDKSILEEKVEELEASLESERASVSSLAAKTGELEAEKAQKDTTITSYVSELDKYKNLVEELKAKMPLGNESNADNPTYS